MNDEHLVNDIKERRQASSSNFSYNTVSISSTIVSEKKVWLFLVFHMIILGEHM